MIVLDLSCEHHHQFEGWFASTTAFDAQADGGQIECPVCGSHHIVRRPSAPYVNIGASAPGKPGSVSPATKPSPAANAAASLSADEKARLVAMLRLAGRNSEDVGERFPEEARRIHYGETDQRAIRGKASGDDVQELLEEGILVLPVPPDEDSLH